MKCLTLLRHAKSSWSDPELGDFDRPLNKRGRRDAPVMGRRLAERDFQPDLALVSPAIRTRMTIEAVAGELALDPAKIVYDDRLYLATVEELVDLARAIPEVRRNVLLVGHNPGFTDLANYLVSGNLENMPTCSVVSVELQASLWRNLERGGARLLYFDYPKGNSKEFSAAEGETT